MTSAISMSMAPTRPRKKSTGQWVVAVLLALVSAIPIAVGIYVLVELAAGHVIPETVRHLASPASVVLHVVGATAYATFGAFQFVVSFRRRFPAGTSRGRVLLVCGLAGSRARATLSIPACRTPTTCSSSSARFRRLYCLHRPRLRRDP